jgi:hypothetical protein
MNARKPLARVVARSKQLGVDVQYLHGLVAAGVPRIGLEKSVKSSPVITRSIAGRALRFVIHTFTLVDSCLESTVPIGVQVSSMGSSFYQLVCSSWGSFH